MRSEQPFPDCRAVKKARAALPHSGEVGAPPLVVVLGNPNAGKSTIFNRLTGLSQRVGNYPGVTVEKKEGVLDLESGSACLIDLPGTYSLAAHSPDEMVAVDVLLGQQAGSARPDAVLLVVDASNLERNLYLFSQVRELDIRIVVGLNMTDVARRHGIAIDVPALSLRLGVPVVPLEGHRGVGIALLRQTLERVLTEGDVLFSAAPVPPVALPHGIVREAERLRDDLDGRFRAATGRPLHTFEALRALVDSHGAAEERMASVLGADVRERIAEARRREAGDLPLVALEAQARYAWIHERLVGCTTAVDSPRRSLSERVDRVLTHRVLGLVIFAVMMLVVFQSIFAWAQPLMDVVDQTFARLGAFLGAMLPDGVLRSLVVDGVVSGAGAVVIFLPQILILFFAIGLLEDCGYMARAAFLMDRVMAKCGLSGKSFIPMLSGFACAVPGVMAARVIENRRDRIATILVTPLMSCSARLPVYTIFIATFIPDIALLGGLVHLRSLVLFGLYALGIVAAVVTAWVLKRTLLRGATPPFLLELPEYRRPSIQGVFLRLLVSGKAFLVRAGTMILAISIIIWALAYFPRPAEIAADHVRATERSLVALASLELCARACAGPMDLVLPAAEILARVEADRLAAGDAELSGAYLRQSYFGRLGRFVEPVFRPLGWEWRISMAAIASFPAREVIVVTLGTIFNLGVESTSAPGSGEAESTRKLSERLREARREGTDQPVFTAAVALSIMVFFALCCQCGATLVTIRRETGSWGWAALTFGYMTVLAYVGALAVYQLGSRLL